MMTTTFTTACEPGAVVTLLVEFTNRRGRQQRPAVVVSVDPYHRERDDTVIVAVTSQRLDAPLFGDCIIQQWQLAGLNVPSKAKGVIETVQKREVYKRIGTLAQGDFERLQQSMRDIMGL